MSDDSVSPTRARASVEAYPDPGKETPLCKNCGGRLCPAVYGRWAHVDRSNRTYCYSDDEIGIPVDVLDPRRLVEGKP